MYNIELMDNTIYKLEDERYKEFKKAISEKNRRFIEIGEDLVAIHQIKTVKKIKSSKINDLDKYLGTNHRETIESKQYKKLKEKMLKT